MNRTSRWPLRAVIVVNMLACAAQAADINFQQVSWTDGAGNYTSQFSDWGRATMSFSPADLAHFAFDPDVGFVGYVNVMTSVQGGHQSNWAVQNLPVVFESSDAINGRLPESVRFDLGVQSGLAVGNLSYSMNISQLPVSAPTSGAWFGASVANQDYYAFGGINDDGGGGANSASNFFGTDGDGIAGPASTIRGNESDIEHVQEGKNGCGPGSVARSLKYLAKHNSNVKITDSAQDVYKDLTQSMGQNGGGVTEDKLKAGKKAYTDHNKLPIKTESNKGPGYSAEKLKKGADVEIFIGGQPLGHFAMVVEIIPILDPKNKKNIKGWKIKYVDDNQQDNKKTANETNTITVSASGNNEILPNGTTGRPINTFIIETVIPGPGAWSLASIGAVVMCHRRRH
ncbi:MAG: hypothetical protein IT435_08300 [Phycisphaerales bacterium]|nr:hypothetical protein [Phycisphaerales bacterium]